MKHSLFLVVPLSRGYAQVEVTGSTFSNNQANYDGGALHLAGAGQRAAVSRCWFESNRAGTYGEPPSDQAPGSGGAIVSRVGGARVLGVPLISHKHTLNPKT